MASPSPTQVLTAFYGAETQYMQAAGSGTPADFSAMAATLDPGVLLHQSPDLPFGGEYVGHTQYQAWADAMSAIFDRVEAANPTFFEHGDAVVATCTLRTRVRATGRQLEWPMVQVVTVKNGKIIEFRPFYWNVPDYSAAAAER